MTNFCSESETTELSAGVGKCEERGWAPGSGRAFAALVSAILLVSCSPGEDRLYRARIEDVLEQATTLEAHADAYATDVANFAEADAIIGRFKASVSALPAPRARDLRYLSLRLEQLGQAAEDLRGSQKDMKATVDRTSPYAIASGDSAFTKAWRYHQTCKAEFRGAFDVVAAAEHVVLKTRRLEDQARARWVGMPGDTSMAADLGEVEAAQSRTEDLVRRDIAQFR